MHALLLRLVDRTESCPGGAGATRSGPATPLVALVMHGVVVGNNSVIYAFATECNRRSYAFECPYVAYTH